MFAALLGIYPLTPAPCNRAPSAIHRPAPVAEGGVLPCFGGLGTGGVENVQFVLSRQGYSPFQLQKEELETKQDAIPHFPHFPHLMAEVRDGFGRTMSQLPAVFGVSRQTLYNWLNGETPKAQHQTKIVQLAAAARVFTEAGFKPTALSLDRTVAQGKTFIELIGQGADGKDTAERLIRIERRGVMERKKLEDLLGDRESLRPDIEDMGRRAFNEDI